MNLAGGVTVRNEQPHPGTRQRFVGGGMRITARVTSTRIGQLTDLELRHRRRACCDNRVRMANDTGLRRLPLTA